MLYYLFQCRSLTYAQRTAAILERSGISCYFMRTPRRLAGEGCSYCVKLSDRNAEDAFRILLRAGLPPIRIFRPDSGGGYREVEF